MPPVEISEDEIQLPLLKQLPEVLSEWSIGVPVNRKEAGSALNKDLTALRHSK